MPPELTLARTHQTSLLRSPDETRTQSSLFADVPHPRPTADAGLVAPTGVAADNIGGRTYQQLLPVASRGDLNRPNIRPKGKRKDKLCKDWKGVTHAILDEMSMLGRRNLGQIDELLRCATNRDETFGGINPILVGVPPTV